MLSIIEDKGLGKTKIQSRSCPECKTVIEVEVSPKALRAYAAGLDIQQAFPQLTRDEAERFITGLHGECWTKWTGPEDDDA